MGLFDFVGDAWNGATHLASDAWNGATHIAEDAWTGVSDAAGDAWHGFTKGLGVVGHFLADHWKTIAAVAVGTLAFVAVATFAPELLPGLFALAPELAPWLVLGGAGAASGATTRIFDDLVNGRRPGWDVLKSAAITGAFTVVTAGTLQWLAPQIGEAIPVLKPLTDRIVVVGSRAADGASGAGNAVVRPVIEAPPVASAPQAAATDGSTALANAGYEPMSPWEAALRAPKTRGIIGLLSGDAGNAENKRLDEKKTR